MVNIMNTEIKPGIDAFFNYIENKYRIHDAFSTSIKPTDEQYAIEYRYWLSNAYKRPMTIDDFARETHRMKVYFLEQATKYIAYTNGLDAVVPMAFGHITNHPAIKLAEYLDGITDPLIDIDSPLFRYAGRKMIETEQDALLR